jgi:hypothetical protein
VILDVSLANDNLYEGLDRPVLAGKPTLTAAPEDAIAILFRNLVRMECAGLFDRDEIVLTGGMAIWAYLAIFHFLHGKTKRVYYQDGRGNKILVAAHG